MYPCILVSKVSLFPYLQYTYMFKLRIGETLGLDSSWQPTVAQFTYLPCAFKQYITELTQLVRIQVAGIRIRVVMKNIYNKRKIYLK